MGIVRRESERLVDSLLQLLRQDVLEPFGFVVHLIHVHAERLREIELQQPVVADHLERDPLTGRSELDAVVGLVGGQFEHGGRIVGPVRPDVSW